MSSITDIQAECRDLCDADTSNYDAATMLRRNNQDYETVVGWILQSDGRWQFDDNNFTTFPTATTTLVNGQKDYTFDTTFLKLLGVSVMNKNGIYNPLIPIDRDDMQGIDYAQYAPTSGLPVQYDKNGLSVVVFPAPDNGVSVTLATGLKAYFQRTADLFTSAQVTAGTKVPGFASPWHMVLAYMGAIPYCIKYHPERVQAYEMKVARMKDELVKFYSKRDKDERTIMKPKLTPFI